MVSPTPIASAPPNSVSTSDLRTKKFISKGTRMSVSAIQLMLHERGYGELLHIKEFGSDGSSGPNTRNARMTYARENGIESDGDRLTQQANILIHVTSYFRTSPNVAGAIVKTPTRSKHRTGHAIDVIDG